MLLCVSGAAGYIAENRRHILDVTHPSNLFELLRNNNGVTKFHDFDMNPEKKNLMSNDDCCTLFTVSSNLDRLGVALFASAVDL